MALDIPDEHQQTIKTWLELPDARVAAVLEALETAGPAPHISALLPALVSAGFSEEEGARLLGFLGSFVMSERHASTRDRYLASVYETVAGSSFDALDLSSQQAVLTRLQAALDSQTVRTTSKAMRLRKANHHTYVDATLVSDVRPVLLDDTLVPTGALVVHQLQIRFTGGGLERGSFAVTLDHEDLERMHRLLARALAKDVALRDWLHGAGLRDLDGVETQDTDK